MIKLPPKSRLKFRSPYTAYNKKSYYGQPSHRKLSPRWLILAIPASIVALELLAHILLGITGQRDKIPAYSPQFKSYQPQFFTQQGKPIDGLPQQGMLKMRQDPPTGYQLLPESKNEIVQVNAQGFRDRQAISLTKPKGELRIFVVGGSAAFGQGASNNTTTIAEQLENRLQQQVKSQQQNPAQFRPDWFPFFPPTRAKLMQMPAKIREGNYRVVNAAVPGYASGNTLAQIFFKILPYHPDLVIYLGGYEDLMLSSTSRQAEIPKIEGFLANAAFHLQATVEYRIRQWLGNSAIASVIALASGTNQSTLNQTSLPLNLDNRSLNSFLPENEAEFKLRRDRFSANQSHLAKLTAQANIPLLLAIQPEITAFDPSKLSPAEQSHQKHLGKPYRDRLSQFYPQFVKSQQAIAQAYPQQVKTLNFHDPNFKVTAPIFSDTVNLTDKANAAVAETLYQTLAKWEKMQLIPQNYDLKPDKNRPY